MVEPSNLIPQAAARLRSFSRRLLIGLFAPILLGTVVAQAPATATTPTLLIYPFDSQDVLLGVALADEVATSLQQHAVVVGPDVAPGAIPPVIVEGGFISIGRALGAPLFLTAAGADLLRTGTGVDVAATGRIELRDSGALLRLFIAYEGGSRHVELRADLAQPERLAALAAALLRGILDDVAGTRGATTVVLPAPPSLVGDFSNTAYGGYVRSVALISAGLIADALVELNEVVRAQEAPERAAVLLADLNAAVSGTSVTETSPSSLVRRALLSVATSAQDPDAAQAAFEAMSAATGMALADVWRGALAASVNDRLGAREALDLGSEEFDYGRAVRASFLLSRGSDEYLADVDALLAAGPAAGSAALMGASLVAEVAGDADRERASLLALSRAAPFMAYPLDKLSHIYFDAGDGRAAAEALAVAVELEPESDLYWTNLGWAYYLVGALEDSEAASTRALMLNGMQEVAAYNLGLVRAATGRLAEALSSYQQALRADPVVNEEAIADLENARGLFQGQSALDYSLGVLYEANGNRPDARKAYRRFVRLAAVEDEMAEFVVAARERLVVLSAPLPPLVIEEGLRLSLGSRGSAPEPYHAGDPLYPTFELTTPGDELPAKVNVTVSLLPAEASGDDEALVTVESSVLVPAGAVGFVVDVVELTLPLDLAAGDYFVTVAVQGDEGQLVTAGTGLTVAGGPDLLRRLVGRSLVMTAFESGRPLYSVADLGGERLMATLVQELRDTADLAEQALPAVETGRFAGLSGGELFRDSSEQDVEDFLSYVLASEARDSRFSFVDAYAQWALDGAPSEPASP